MKITEHKIKDQRIAELISDEYIIQTSSDALNILGDLYFQGFDGVIIYEKNIVSDFFDLKNGMAGEILQKFSNYRVRLILLGDFSKYRRKSIREFIFESNKGKLVNFLPTFDEALIAIKGE